MKEKIISVAPMVDRTDRHFRYMMRQITKKALLYTEMITAQAIINGDRRWLLDFDFIEKPIALQIAGSNLNEVVEAVKISEGWDYDEININVGCPSDRISGNEMGAILMAYPDLVRDMVKEIKKVTKKPITIKHRVGIDGKNILPDTFERTLFDKYEDMINFIEKVEEAKADRYTVHARIAILEGLSPKENREIPPIRYEDVYRLKRDKSHLNIEINGGIKTLEDVKKHLEIVDGVMIGREAYDNPVFMSFVDRYFNLEVNKSRYEIVEAMINYGKAYEENGGKAYAIARHMLGLFYGLKGARAWKQGLESRYIKELGLERALKRAMENVDDKILHEKI